MLPINNLSINRIILESPYHQPTSIAEAIMRIEIMKQYNRTILLNLQLMRGQPIRGNRVKKIKRIIVTRVNIDRCSSVESSSSDSRVGASQNSMSHEFSISRDSLWKIDVDSRSWSWTTYSGLAEKGSNLIEGMMNVPLHKSEGYLPSRILQKILQLPKGWARMIWTKMYASSRRAGLAQEEVLSKDFLSKE